MQMRWGSPQTIVILSLCVRDEKDILCEKEENELKEAAKEMSQDKIQNEKWQGKLLTAREEDQGLDRRHVLLGYGSGLCALFTQWQECMSSTSSFYRLSYTTARG